ncbi:YfhO family protein [Candidatus Margulisiibacteriota bacterium]
MGRSRNINKDLLAIAFLLLLAVIMFWKAATLQGIFFSPDSRSSDLAHWHYPLKTYIAESIKSGKLPLWIPNSFCGFPLLGEGQVGIFYPFNLLLFYILPAWIALNYSILLAIFLAGWFMYLYIRGQKLSRSSALLAAIVFMFSGYFVAHVRHPNIIQSAGWIPLQFLLMDKGFEVRDKGVNYYFLLLGFVSAIQLLAWHPQIPFYVVIALLFYSLFKLAQKKKKNVFILNLLLALLLTIGIASVQLLPTLEYTRESVRSAGMDAQAALNCSLSFAELFVLGGTTPEKSFYVGILPIILIFLSLLRSKPAKKFSVPNGWFYIFLLCFSLLLAFGSNLPLHEFIFKLPGFNLFRAPTRILVLTVFSLAVLTAYSVRKLRLNLMVPIIGIIVVDLFFFGLYKNTTVPVSDYFKKPGTVKFLEGKLGPNRILSVGGLRIGPKGWQEVIHPNLNILYGMPSASGYFPFGLRRNKVLLTAAAMPTGRQEKKGAKLLGLLNVKYVISPLVNRSKDFKLVYQTEGLPLIRIYENKKLIPRSFLVPKAITITKSQHILSKLCSADFDPLKQVILEEEVTLGQNAKILVTSDTYYPGWKAFVNGTEKKIYRANYMMRAVVLNQGENAVKFVYDPLTVKVGAAISFFSFLFFLAGLLKKYKRA